jgi:hypothetical protein
MSYKKPTHLFLEETTKIEPIIVNGKAMLKVATSGNFEYIAPSISFDADKLYMSVLLIGDFKIYENSNNQLK